MAAKRSLSLTRSSSAPVMREVPLALAAAKRKAGNSSMRLGTSCGLYVGGPELRVTRRHSPHRFERFWVGDLHLDVRTHALESRKQAGASRVETHTLHRYL